MRGYNTWNGHLLSTRTQYIRLTREKNVAVLEVAVYVTE
jgi:hypothetical protein